MGKNRVLFNEVVRERFIEKLILKQKPKRDEGSRKRRDYDSETERKADHSGP